MSTEPPVFIKRKPDLGKLEIAWRDGQVDLITFHALRCECQCAGCIHEITHERLLDPADVPGDIHIKEMSLVGNYAVKFLWSDGHDTGLYTWEFLRRLGAAKKKGAI
jgi:DUF971 family protein